MKRLYPLVLSVALVFGCGENTSPHEKHGHPKQEVQKVYTCPMHPDIVRNEPGQCPICGMKLVEKTKTDENINSDEIGILLKPANEVVLSNIKTVFPKQMELSPEYEVSGFITYDTKRISSVSARVAGRVDKLFVKYLYQPVLKGQKLMEIYSKELVTEQDNFIYLLKNDPENKSLIAAAENRLLLLGLTAEQANELRNEKKIFQSLEVFSPYSGHLHDLSRQSAGPIMENKGSQELTLKEGMHVQKGQTLFNIYSTEKVWTVLSIFPDAQSDIEIGNKVFLFVIGTNDSIEATIDFIEPLIREGQQTVSVRIFLDNKKGNLKIGSLVKAIIISHPKSGITVPASSIINLGTTDIVFVKQEGVFRSKAVKRGKATADGTEIISGITGRDQIALNAQMLVDSESFIRINE